jgi:hypothetical protein
MAKLRKTRIRWNPSATSNVEGYKLYWAVGGGVNYDSDSVQLGNATEVILPDNVTLFPIVADDIQLGITAVNEMGNESDMTRLTFPFNFTAPNAPMDPVVESMEEFWWSQE